MSGRVGLEVGTGLAGRRVLILVCYHIEAGIPKTQSFLFSDTRASSGVVRKIACVLRSVFAEGSGLSGRDRTPGYIPGIVLPPFKGAEGSWNT